MLLNTAGLGYIPNFTQRERESVLLSLLRDSNAGREVRQRQIGKFQSATYDKCPLSMLDT